MADGETYDLIVIGAGPGGYVAAIRAAQLGLRVACVEKEPKLGGTCLRVGCIPSKALLDSSELFYRARKNFQQHGIQLGEVGLDLSKMLKRKDGIVDGLTQGVDGLFKKNKVAHVQGTASLLAPGKVKVKGDKNAQTLESKHVLIATGSAPAPLADVPFDGKRVVSSTEALSFAKVPERLLVIGGGYIGLEMGSVWARLGSNVTVVEMLDRVVPAMDAELGKRLQQALERQGLQFVLSARAAGVEAQQDGVRVQLRTRDGGKRFETVERVLVAAGRRPHTAGLGLAQLGIETDKDGRIPVNARYETSVEGIYAIGDVIPGLMLAHKAEEEGIAVAELLAGQAGHVNYEAIPSAVYTHPEFAAVGKTEAQCQEEGIAVKTGKFPFKANGRARGAGETDGLVKLVADAETDRVLGVHVLGPHASDLIAECALALEFSASAEDLARTCHAHPSFPEAIKEAALDVAGRRIHL